MGARVIVKSPPHGRRKRETRLIATVICATVFPLLLAFVLIALDIKPDLSGLRVQSGSGSDVVSWPAVPNHLTSHARMLGYMMDGETGVRDGTPVTHFILMPDAGQFLHPAHRDPEEMAQVSLEKPIPFRFRELVWVSGDLAREPGKPQYGKPEWRITRADAQPAPASDIAHWFQP